MNTTLPRLKLADLTADEMYAAYELRDSKYDGVFYLAVKTTGIFCRPTCTARMPRRKNVEFFADVSSALSAGFRPCKRCRPLEVAGQMPRWLVGLVDSLDAEPGRKWKDADIRERGVEPTRVRRWFQQNHGITFHSYLRSRRLSTALAQLSLGDDPTAVAYDVGYESLSGFRDAFQKWFGSPPGEIHNGQMVLDVTRILSPLGPLVAAASAEHLFLLEFADRRMLETQFQRLSRRVDCRFSPGENDVIVTTAREVDEYFQGQRQRFEVPTAIVGTEFQKQVWQELLKIEYGSTKSYEQIARMIGNPSGQRAVGRANGDNRLGIIVPCHRVIRSNGHLSGYGGGLRRKQWLLNHERGNQLLFSTRV